MNEPVELNAGDRRTFERPAATPQVVERGAVELEDARRVLEAAFARGWLDEEQRDTAQKVLHRLAKALTAPAGEAELVIAEDGSGFALAEGDWVDLSRRRPLRRLLAALLDVRRAGRKATKQDLIAAGWPGERLLPDAAANRLHVALSELRKLGLARAIVYQGDGWTLDPALAIEVTGGGQSSATRKYGMMVVGPTDSTLM